MQTNAVIKNLSQHSIDILMSGILNHCSGTEMPLGLEGHSLETLLKATQANYNQLTTEFNELIDVVESHESKIDNYDLKEASIRGQLKRSEQLEANAKFELAQAQLSLAEVNKRLSENSQQNEVNNKLYAKQVDLAKVAQKAHLVSQKEVARLAKEQKRNKAQITRLKEKQSDQSNKALSNSNIKLHKLVEQCTLMHKELLVYRGHANAVNLESYVAPLFNLYTDETCHVLLVDKPQLVEVSGQKESFLQYTLLFAHKCGTYYTYCVDSSEGIDGNTKFVMSSGLFAPNGTSQDKLSDLGQYEVKVPKHVEDAIESWLLKVNVVQNGKLEPEDYHMDLPTNIFPTQKHKTESKAMRATRALEKKATKTLKVA